MQQDKVRAGAAVRLLTILFLAAWLGHAEPARAEEALRAPTAGGRALSLSQMAGQLILTGFRGATPAECAGILEDVRAGRAGGVILFSRDVARNLPDRNILSPQQVKMLNAALQNAAREGTGLPLLVAVDQEGGRVARLTPARGFLPSRSAAELGAAGSLLQLNMTAQALGAELRDCGFNLDFAPVADVNVNPQNPVIGKIGRSFSADPEVVSACDLEFLRGLQAAGVLGCLKHFPGHGSAYNDSHAGMTDITETWNECELQPYRDLILRGACPLIMTGHLFNRRLDADYPATLSYKTLTGLLRGQLGYDGVIITDDLQMKAISDHYGMEQAALLAIRAGADILLIGNNLSAEENVARKLQEALVREAGRDPAFRTRVAESCSRVLRLKAQLPAGLPAAAGATSGIRR